MPFHYEKTFAGMTVILEGGRLIVQSPDDCLCMFIKNSIHNQLVKEGYHTCCNLLPDEGYELLKEARDNEVIFRLGNEYTDLAGIAPPDAAREAQFGKQLTDAAFRKAIDAVAARYRTVSDIENESIREVMLLHPPTKDELKQLDAEMRGAIPTKWPQRYDFTGYEAADRAMEEMIREFSSAGYYVTYRDSLSAERDYLIHRHPTAAEYTHPELARISYNANPLHEDNRGTDTMPVENCRAHIEIIPGTAREATYINRVFENAARENGGVEHKWIFL